MTDNLSLLRAELARQKLDGFILPVNDEFMGEYVPDSAKRLTWLTGFTGSAGMAVVLKDKAAFFTDGRYTLQAKDEVGQGFAHYNSGDVSPEKWVSEHAPNASVIGYDPKLHTLNALKRYEKVASTVSWKAVTPNPIDSVWKDRPAAPKSAVRLQPLQYAGESSAEKRARMAKEIVASGADALILSAPDSICWLLNIRGSDVPFTPFILAYALLLKSGKMLLYIDAARISPDVAKHLGDVVIKPPLEIKNCIAKLAGERVLYDAVNSPVWFYYELKAAGAYIIEGTDPCQLAKACKNAAELEGMYAAHMRDGLAVTKFLHWLDRADKASLTEMDVAAKLEGFRKQSNLYLEPSFTTISGSGPNGAVVHYRVTDATNRKLDNNSLLLVDSGGQYADGTTDITRTIAIGTPSAEMKDRFTRVLKGHIAIATAIFPEGTSGSQLDALARQYLWQVGLDYDHGTGHGVGSYLSVHEGPQRISKRGGDAPLVPGMIVSNEPGYYKAGEYGIRIESLVVVKEVYVSGARRYFEFDTLTLAPIDMRLVDMALLTPQETQWLAQYNQKVFDVHKKQLDSVEKGWFEQALQGNN